MFGVFKMICVFLRVFLSAVRRQVVLRKGALPRVAGLGGDVPPARAALIRPLRDLVFSRAESFLAIPLQCFFQAPAFSTPLFASFFRILP